MQVPFFDYQRQLNTIRKEVNEAFDRVLDSGWLILGEEVSGLEKEFAAYIGTEQAIGVNSGTDAIKIALRSLGVGPGDEIITVSNAGVPPVSAIRELGAIPRFVDIKADYTLDENQLESLISEKTKAIMPVHLYGLACNMPAIVAVAKKHDIYVIEDCSQAHGAAIDGKKVGSWGDIACFSFYPTKNLGAYGDAGIITTSNTELADKCRCLRQYGWNNNKSSQIEGYNSRLDEVQAAFLRIKLQKLDSWLQRRQQIAGFYLNSLVDARFNLPVVRELSEHAFHLFVISVEARDEFVEYLKTSGVGCGIHYPEPVHLMPAYKSFELQVGRLSATEAAAKTVVSLPIYPELSDEEVEYIVSKIGKY